MIMSLSSYQVLNLVASSSYYSWWIGVYNNAPYTGTSTLTNLPSIM